MADRTTLPRLPVWWRVVRRVRDRGYRYKGEGVVDRLGVVDLARHPVIAIWPANASRGEPASLVFDAEDNAWASRTSEGSGDLIGEAAINGACCIETEFGVIWPAYNPHVPVIRPPRR